MPEILAGLIGHAETTAKPEALAMLRVLAVLGPPEIAPAASQAADRLVAAGLTDRAWVAGLGTPQVGPCSDSSTGEVFRKGSRSASATAENVTRLSC